MATPLTVLLIAVAVVLAATALWLLRSGNQLPWPTLGLSSLTCAVCFTVGGATGADLDGPDIATLMGALVGFATLLAAILALVPRDTARNPLRLPTLVGTVAVVVGSVGLVVSLLTTR